MKGILKTEITWKKLLIMTVLISAMVAALNCIPVFEGTSFQLPAITEEFWFLPALFIVLNAKGYKDAMLKILVFFLIGQPLIYLFEVPFKAQGFGLFRFYPYWFKITLLTVPAAVLAYRVKKDGILSAFILSLCGLLMFMTRVDRIHTVMHRFPKYFIAFLFCLLVRMLLCILCWKIRKQEQQDIFS